MVMAQLDVKYSCWLIQLYSKVINTNLTELGSSLRMLVAILCRAVPVADSLFVHDCRVRKYPLDSAFRMVRTLKFVMKSCFLLEITGVRHQNSVTVVQYMTVHTYFTRQSFARFTYQATVHLKQSTKLQTDKL